jgi:hypothetical protein
VKGKHVSVKETFIYLHSCANAAESSSEIIPCRLAADKATIRKRGGNRGITLGTFMLQHESSTSKKHSRKISKEV